MNKVIGINKIYLTRDGRKARIICTDRDSKDYPVVALIKGLFREDAVYYTTEGKYLTPTKVVSDFDLVSEYSKWDDVAVDTPIIVWNEENSIRHRRYFSHYENGVIHTFPKGTTSWSNTIEDRQTWIYGEVKWTGGK